MPDINVRLSALSKRRATLARNLDEERARALRVQMPEADLNAAAEAAWRPLEDDLGYEVEAWGSALAATGVATMLLARSQDGAPVVRKVILSFQDHLRPELPRHDMSFSVIAGADAEIVFSGPNETAADGAEGRIPLFTGEPGEQVIEEALRWLERCAG